MVNFITIPPVFFRHLQVKYTQYPHRAAHVFQLMHQLGAIVRCGICRADKLNIKIIFKLNMGQRTAFDGFHVKAALADDLDHPRQPPRLVVHRKQHRKPLPRCGGDRLPLGALFQSR